jgi:uncharacterized protein (DUF433 family)
MQTKLYNRIVVNAKIMVGKPIIKGTRITVELILHLLAQGQTVNDIIANYPHLKKQDVFAAIENFATRNCLPYNRHCLCQG